MNSKIPRPEAGAPSVYRASAIWWSTVTRIITDYYKIPGRPTNLDNIVGQGPAVLAVGAGGGCLDIFSLIYHFSAFSLSLGDGPI